MLNCDPNTTILGEHYGVLDELRNVNDIAKAKSAQFSKGRRHLSAIAGNLDDVDDLSEHINWFDGGDLQRLTRQWFWDLFAPVASQCAVWGFKEVRYGAATLEFIDEVVPGTKVIVLARRPHDQISSAIRAPWVPKAKEEDLAQRAAALAADWVRRYESFLQYADRHSTRTRIVTYENLVGNDFDLSELFGWLGVEADPAAIEAVRGARQGSSSRNPRWTVDEQAKLTQVLEHMRPSESMSAIVSRIYGDGFS